MKTVLFKGQLLAPYRSFSLGTLHRKVADLVEAGYLKREKRGKSVCLAPTDDTCGSLDQSFEDMVGALRRLYERVRL